MNSHVPEGYNNVIPYLIVNNATGFLDFLKGVFMATEHMKHMTDENTVMHAEVRIGNSVIMLADATDQYPPSPAGMFIYVPDADVAYNAAIAAGSTSVLPVEDKPYGRSGGVRDPYGNTWWITAQADS